MTPGFSPEAEKMGHHQGEGLQEEAGMTSLFEVPRDTGPRPGLEAEWWGQPSA